MIRGNSEVDEGWFEEIRAGHPENELATRYLKLMTGADFAHVLLPDPLAVYARSFVFRRPESPASAKIRRRVLQECNGKS